MAEPGFISSHTPTSGAAFVQTSPNMQARCGEPTVAAGRLMSIDPADGKAYLCDANSVNCVPAGFAASDFDAASMDGGTRLTLVRQGRIGGFAGLVPGALYYPSAVTPGAIVPERTTAGPVITAVTATAGTGFLGNVHIREGHRPKEGVWTFAFPTATTCTVTPPSGTAGAAVTVAADTDYNGTVAADFFIRTMTLSPGDSATVTVSYTTPAAVVQNINSPGNAFASFSVLKGGAGLIAKGIWHVTTTATTAGAGFNGGALNPATAIATSSTYSTIIPGVSLTTEDTAVTAETNWFMVDAQKPVPAVGIAVDESTLQITMGGNC